LQVLKLPANVGTTWAVTSTDQKTGEVETFTAKVLAIGTADACGSLVQGYQVELSGRLSTSAQQFPLTFTEDELIAPQFGGLVLADKATVVSQQSPTTSQTQTVSDTIDVTPTLPLGGTA
jgi:hypothetical protein